MLLSAISRYGHTTICFAIIYVCRNVVIFYCSIAEFILFFSEIIPNFVEGKYL